MAKTDTQQVKSKRDLALERLQSRHPDTQFADDEAIFGQIGDDYEDYDKRIAGYQEREKAFAGMFGSDPRTANFLMDWKNGKDPLVEFVRRFGKDALEDESKLEEIAAANKEYLDRIAENDNLEKQYQDNVAKSLDLASAFEQKHGLSEEEGNKVLDLIAKISKDYIVGVISEETLELALKALNHDSDVDDAGREGEARGANKKIDEKLRKKGKTDTVPAVQGQTGAAAPAEGKRDLGVLGHFGNPGPQNIWEAGNEKRTRRNNG